MKEVPGRKAFIIESNDKDENYDYHAKCPNCGQDIFKGNFCSNCGVPTRWVTPGNSIEERLSELLMFALHGNADDLSDYMRERQKETVRLVKKILKEGETTC